MEKFPVVRDLVVNRRRLFRALEKVRAWIPVDGYYDMGAGPRVSPEQQQQAYPAVGVHELRLLPGCLPAVHEARGGAARGGIGRGFRQARASGLRHAFCRCPRHQPGHALQQPSDRRTERRRAARSAHGPGGIQDCGNAQNCVNVCPKKIPLTTSIGRAGRATALRAITKWFSS